MRAASVRISAKRDFAQLRKSGIRNHGELLSVTFLPSELETSYRLAFAVSKKVGNAVIRNRVRRRVKAIFMELDDTPDPGLYLVVAKTGSGSADFETLRADLKSTLRSVAVRSERLGQNDLRLVAMKSGVSGGI